MTRETMVSGRKGTDKVQKTYNRLVDERGNWIDAQGRPVPPRYIEKEVKDRDRMVRRNFIKAMKLKQHVVKVKTEVVLSLDEYLDGLAAEHDTSWKGNAELITFDGRLKVEVKVNEALEFDERLQLAKQKIDDCLRRWTGSARTEIRAIISQAFQMDRKGRINVRSILTLRQFRFEDPQWREAMTLISDSLRIRSTRRYVNFYLKDDTTGRFVLIPLNWSALAPGSGPGRTHGEPRSVPRRSAFGEPHSEPRKR